MKSCVFTENLSLEKFSKFPNTENDGKNGCRC